MESFIKASLMSYEFAVGAAFLGAGLLTTRALLRMSRREGGINGGAFAKDMVPQSAAHFLIWPVVPQFRKAVVAVATAGFVNAVEQPFVTMGPKWGVMHWLYVSVQGPVMWSIVGAWACRSPTLGLVAPGVAAAGGLAMCLFAPRSGYFFDVLFGLAMLRARPVEEGKPFYTSSGWWLGVAHKGVSLAHCLFALTQPSMTEATRALFAKGFISASELHGVAASFTGKGHVGPVFGIVHFFNIGLSWWVTGSHLQDWALRADRLRTSSAALSFLGWLALSCVMPSSGYLAMIFSAPVALCLVRPVATKTE